jgi:hypothetical protein
MSKPSINAIVDTSNSLTTNLKAAFLLNEGAGTTTLDYVTRSLQLTLSTSSIWSTNGITTGPNQYARITTPASLKLSSPMTVYLRLIPAAGNPTANAIYFGAIYDSAGSSPFASYLISVAGAGPDYAADDNSGGTFVQIVSSVTPASDAGATIDLAMVFNSSAVKLYRNGTSIASISNGNNNPTYGATSQLGFGDIQVLSRNPNAELVFGYIFAADMSASLATIRASP